MVPRFALLKIVTFDNHAEPGLLRAWFLRGFVPGLISQITNGAFGLIDILFIMRQDRRCIHDLIAGTSVVRA